MPSERLARWLARSGVASRRAAERLVEEGRVRVNGVLPPINGMLIDPAQDRVVVDGTLIASVLPQRRYLALNKPIGVVSTAIDPGGRQTVLDLVQDAKGLFPVGRLDIDSRGLILLTDDGDLALRLAHPRYQVPKHYAVTILGELTVSQLEGLRAGPVLVDGPTHPQAVRLLRRSNRRTLIEIEIAEGRQRELRRMCAAVGARVIDLERTAIGPLKLGRSPEGQARELGALEIKRLRAFVGLS